MDLPLQPPVMIYGQPCLRGICQAIPLDYPLKALQNQIATLFAVLQTTGNASSISAPQIGWTQRLFVANLSGGSYAFINPVVVVDDRNDFSEYGDGCISIPGFNGSVPRYNNIKLSYQSIVGSGSSVALQSQSNVLFSNHDAYIIQHELDHLDGVMYIDHLDNRNNAGNPASGSLGYDHGLSNLNNSTLANIAEGNYNPVPYNTQSRNRS